MKHIKKIVFYGSIAYICLGFAAYTALENKINYAIAFGIIGLYYWQLTLNYKLEAIIK